MTTNYHAPITTGETNAPSTINTRLATLDAAISTQSASGGTFTLANGAASAAQAVVTVDSSSGFVAGASVVYTLVGGAIETNTIASVDSATQITLTNNIGTGGIPDNGVIAQVTPDVASASIAAPYGGAHVPTLATAIRDANHGVYNVKRYGAAGDGVTDDTAAIQAAIDAAEAATYRGIVEFPPGIYMVSAELTVQATGVSLRGAGAQYSTTIKTTAGFADDFVLSLYSGTGLYLQGNVVENLEFDCRNASPTNSILYAKQARDMCHLRFLYFKNFTTRAIRCEDGCDLMSIEHIFAIHSSNTANMATTETILIDGNAGLCNEMTLSNIKLFGHAVSGGTSAKAEVSPFQPLIVRKAENMRISGLHAGYYDSYLEFFNVEDSVIGPFTLETGFSDADPTQPYGVLVTGSGSGNVATRRCQFMANGVDRRGNDNAFRLDYAEQNEIWVGSGDAPMVILTCNATNNIIILNQSKSGPYIRDAHKITHGAVTSGPFVVGTTITGAPSGATATIDVVDGGGTYIGVSNVDGTFRVGDTITASGGGANAAITVIAAYNKNVVSGGYRLVALPFYLTDVAASQTNQNCLMIGATFSANMGVTGFVRGLSISASAGKSAGALTFNLFINGSDSYFQHIVPNTSTRTSVLAPLGVYNFGADVSINMKYTTDAGFAPPGSTDYNGIIHLYVAE